jgi:membrane protein
MAAARRVLAWTGRTARRYRHAVPQAARLYVRHHGPQLAAAISYHAFLSLFPLLIFLVSIFGLVLRDEGLRTDLISKLLDRFPLSEQAGADLERILTSIPAPLSAIGLGSLAVVLWSASGMMAALRTALTATFASGSGRPFFHGKLVDLLLVLGTGLVVLVSFGLTVLVQTVERYTHLLASLGALKDVLGVAVPLLLTFGIFLVLYHLVPPGRPPVRQIWAGALLAAVGFELLKTGFALYLATFARYDVVYGSLGTIVAFLFLVYLGASVFLFGAEVAADWPRAGEAAERPPAPGPPWHRQARDVVRGLFIAGPRS